MRIAATCVALTLCALPASADKKLDEAIRKAELQLAKGKDAEAVKILQKETSRAPRDPEAHLALALLQLRLGRPDEANGPLDKAGELAASAPGPIRARVRTAQSAFALRAGKAGDALALARQAVESGSGPESLAALARAEARMGDPKARETAARAVKEAPTSVAAQLAQGDALLAARLGAEAEAAYRLAQQADRRSLAAASGLALALAAQRKAAPALEAARAATALDAKSAEAQAALAIAELARDPEDKKSEAVAAAYQAVALEPKSALAKLTLGRALESGGQVDQAAATYAEAADLDPTWSAARVGALGVQLKRGDAAGALAGLRALAPEQAASGDAQLLLGRILSQQEDWPAALQALDAAALAMPGLAEAHALRAAAAYNNGELKLAADEAGKAVELDPSEPAYLSSHALYLGYDRRLDEALAVMQKTMATPEGQTAQAYLALGAVYRAFRPARVADAVAAYERALKLDPKNGQAALGIALSYRAGKQWTRAISAYERVSQSFPRLDAEAALGTAWCYLASGDETRSKFYTQVAVRGGADVDDIRQAFGRPGAASDELSDLADRLRSKSAGQQARAAREMLEIGRPAVPSLAAALGRKTTAIAVRELIVEGLGALGPAAREALPQLERLAKPAPGGADAADPKASREREAKLAAAAQAAIGRIRSAS
jgi:tetratricopeptide (TPR) repeat protein